MSKFLKFIVNFIVFCTIVVAAALLVPPLAGVHTVMIDDTGMDTNLPMGSVTYSRSVEPDKLKEGDSILIATGAQTYNYIVSKMDNTAKSYTVTDKYNKGNPEQTITIQSAVPKVVITIPYIAYAAMALQSVEGLIIAGLAVVFLIILFILSELWKKDDSEEDEEEVFEEEERNEDTKSKSELRKEKKAAKKAAKAAKKREQQGYDDEEEEVVPIAIEEPKPTVAQVLQGSPEDVMHETMASIAQNVSEASSPEETQEMPKDTVAEELQQTVSFEKEEASLPTEESESVRQENIRREAAATAEAEEALQMERILQAPTAAELIAKATVEGEEPEILEDEEAGVTLLDYSKIL